MPHIYLDHQSATPVLPAVFEAMRPYFTDCFGSPAALHQHGLRARDALDRARQQMAAFLGAESPEEIIFTSDGTEAANLAIKGVAYASARQGHHLVVSAIEHPAVLRSIEFLETQGFACTRVPVDRAGLVAPEAVRAALTDRTILIAVHHANHEVGAIEPVAEIGQLAAERGIPFYVDAEASAGWLPLEVRAMGASLLSFSPHKFYGPKGVGVLYRQPRTRLASQLHGGLQEGGRRAGTENVPAIVGAGVAADLARIELSQRREHVARLQHKLWAGLQAKVPYLQLNGPEPGPRRLPNNLNCSVEFVEGEALLLRGDMQGLAMASGPACLSQALKASHVLTAMGVESALARGNLLLTLGKDNTEAEMDTAVETLARVIAKLRDLSPLWSEFQRGLAPSFIQPREAPPRCG